MNEDIEKIFQGKLTVDEKEIPISFAKYVGSSEDYIVYFNGNNTPFFSSDDETEYSKSEIDFNVYTKGNYLKIVKQLKKMMKENDYDWTGDAGDLYEEDTKYHHLVVTFEKIRRV